MGAVAGGEDAEWVVDVEGRAVRVCPAICSGLGESGTRNGGVLERKGHGGQRRVGRRKATLERDGGNERRKSLGCRSRAAANDEARRELLSHISSRICNPASLACYTHHEKG